MPPHWTPEPRPRPESIPDDAIWLGSSPLMVATLPDELVDIIAEKVAWRVLELIKACGIE